MKTAAFFLIGCAALVALGVASPATLPQNGTAAGKLKPKNVLFIIYDDLRVCQSAFGGDQAVTPNTNALAVKSLILDRAFCQQAVCGPSRASLFSGRRPDVTQMWNFVGGFRQTPGADKWNTMPEWFLKQGYYTAGCGKIFHPDDPKNFDPQSWSEPSCKKNFPYHGQGNCPVKEEERVGDARLGDQRPCPVDPDKYPNAQFPDVETLADAKKYLGKAAADPSTPFWIGVGFVKPHMPHVYPAKFGAIVPSPANISIPENLYADASDGARMNWASGAEGEPAVGWQQPDTNASIGLYKHAYYAAAAFSDSLMGELLAELPKLGLENDTIVVMTADHGWGLGEHNHWVKYTNWETDARIPTMIHVPGDGFPRGVKSNALVEHVDLYPTLAELAGVPVSAKEGVSGTSYANLFENPAADHKEAVFTQYPRCCKKTNKCGDVSNKGMANHKRCASVKKEDFAFMGYSMRSDRWRYTEWPAWDGKKLAPIWNDKRPYVELYDHQGDDMGRWTYERFENVNVASQFPEVVANMSQQLRNFVNKFH